jgi:hypothetical protein
VSTVVGADPQAAFAYVSDLTKHGEWANPKSGLQVTHVDGSGAGARYQSHQTFLGKKAGADITVTVFEPGRQLAFEAVEQGKRYRHTFTFAPQEGGTAITRDIDAPLPPVVSLFAKPAIRKEARVALQALKERLESGLA